MAHALRGRLFAWPAHPQARHISGWVWGHLQSCARGVYSTLDDEANDEDAEAAREQCIKVQQFIEKAISSKVFPDGVEEYVRKHRHDVAEEYQWKVGVTKQIDRASFAVIKQVRNNKLFVNFFICRIQWQEYICQNLRGFVIDL